jgi:hypothetical protein
MVLMGIAVVFLAGPIVAVASVAISLAGVFLGFALVGFLIWLPVRVAFGGSPVTHGELRSLAGALARDVARLGGSLLHVLALPVLLVGWCTRGLLAAGWFSLKTAFWVTRFAVGLAFLTLLGAGLGAAWGVVVAVMEHHEPGPSVVMNTLAGAAIAAVVGIVLALPKRKAAVAVIPHGHA